MPSAQYMVALTGGYWSRTWSLRLCKVVCTAMTSVLVEVALYEYFFQSLSVVRCKLYCFPQPQLVHRAGSKRGTGYVV